MAGCSGVRPFTAIENKMADEKSNKVMLGCPGTPNCVSSESAESRNYIKPIAVKGDAGKVWQKLEDLLQSLSRCKIVEKGDNYIRAEFKSRIFRFVDDLEFYLQADQSYIAVRSASRVGSYDFGVNRRRVEMIRKLLDQ